MIERETLIAMVRGMQNGDGEATARMYETFQDDIYYFILKTVNNDRELAEDLTQDAFVEILEKIQKLEEPAAFVTWSKQIAYHKCTDHFKKRKELLLDENEDGSSAFDIQMEENGEFIPDEALDSKDLKQTIMNMINDLPEEQRAAILLRYFNEISVKEIAQIQRVSEGTVKSRLNYARKAIKQSVEAYEKKSGVKLHCAGVVPLLLWLFREYRVAKKLSMAAGTATQTFVLAEETTVMAGAVTTGATSVGAVTATTATMAAKTAVGAGIKTMATALSTKIVAGVVAAAVVVGGAAAGISAGVKKSAEEQEAEPEATIVQTIEETSIQTVEEPEAPTVEFFVEEIAASEATAMEETAEWTQEPDNNANEVTHIHNWFYEDTMGAYSCLICGEITYEENPVGSDGPGYASNAEVIQQIKDQYGFTTDQEAIDFLNEQNGYTEEISDEQANCEHAWQLEYYDELEGETKYTCSLCGQAQYSYDCGHPEWTEEVTADESTGNTTYTYTCTACGYVETYVDESSESAELTEPSVAKAACAHSSTYAAYNYGAEPYYDLICSDCGEMVAGYIYDESYSTVE